MMNFDKFAIPHPIAIGAYTLGSVGFLSAAICFLTFKDQANLAEPGTLFSNDEYAPVLFAMAALALSISFALSAVARVGQSKSDSEQKHDLVSLADIRAPELAAGISTACLVAWAALGVCNHHDELSSETGFVAWLAVSAILTAWNLYRAQPLLKGMALSLFTRDNRSFYDKCMVDKTALKN